MKALWLLGFALSESVLAAARLEWNAPLGECQPVDLAVAPSGLSFVTCQENYGEALQIISYDLSGRVTISQRLAADPGESWLPRDLLWHDGRLYLGLTQQKIAGTDSALLALDPVSLAIQWQTLTPHFVGSTLVPLQDKGLWWVGTNDARDADILATRYSAAGKAEATFQYDSGAHDTLGFDRRSGAAGPEQSLYIGGFSEVLHVAADGRLLWKTAFPTAAIASTAAGTLIATHMRAPQGGTLHLDSDGKKLWQSDEGGSALAVAPDASIWITGTRVTDATAGWDLRILHLSAQGEVLIRDLYEGPYQDRAIDIATDDKGHAFVLASSYVKTGWSGARDRYLILKYSHSGARLWSYFYGTIGLPEALHVTGTGSVFALGRDGTILLRESPLTPTALDDKE